MGIRPTAKEFSTKGDQYIGRSYEEMDCQEFFERMLAAVGIHENLAGSNAWYRRIRKNGWVGTPEECKRKFGQIPVGAVLFIHSFNGGEPAKYHGDGLGNASHIGVYIARADGAINSSSSRGCVAYSKFKGKSINGGWNMIGLPIDILDYGLYVEAMISGGDTSTGGDKMPEEEKTGKVVPTEGSTGSTVNLRSGPARSEKLIERVPFGETVTILEDLGEWCKIRWKSATGYMMSNYIEYDGAGKDEDSGDMIQIARNDLQKLYDTIGDWLGLRG